MDLLKDLFVRIFMVYNSKMLEITCMFENEEIAKYIIKNSGIIQAIS